jgi:DNA-binding NarL/FixJ family response regulator
VLAALHDFEQSLPEVPIILLYDRDDVEEVAKAVLHGVRGFVSTRLDGSELAAAIHSVAAGSTFVRADTLVKLVSRATSKEDKTPWEDLTPREMEVVARLRQGKPNKAIAHELKISESTVKAFVRRILIKLNALNRTEVAQLTEGRFERIQAAAQARDPESPEPAERPPTVKEKEG